MVLNYFTNWSHANLNRFNSNKSNNSTFQNFPTNLLSSSYRREKIHLYVYVYIHIYIYIYIYVQTYNYINYIILNCKYSLQLSNYVHRKILGISNDKKIHRCNETIRVDLRHLLSNFVNGNDGCKCRESKDRKNVYLTYFIHIMLGCCLRLIQHEKLYFYNFSCTR